jgi:hypothetical protein
MIRLILALLLLAPLPALAQSTVRPEAVVVTACGTAPNSAYATVGGQQMLVMDVNGTLCTTAGSGGGGGVVTQPTASNLNATVVGAGTAGTANANPVTVQGIAGMTKLLVTPDSVALPANQSVNVAQVNGITTLTGAGASGTGSQRHTVAQDTTTIAGSAPGTAGTPSANVVTVQGAASMTKLLVTPDAATSTPAAATASAIVTGGTAVTLITGPVNGCYVTNPLTLADENIAAAEVAYVNPVTTATANGRGTNSALQPGQTFTCPPGMTTNLSAIAATTAHAFNVVKW